MVLASRSAVRERVPWPNPRLAMFDTCRRMSSIEVVRLVSRGPGRPSTSHRILGFRVARARFFLVLSARHPVDSFMVLLCRPWHLQRESMRDGDEGVGLKGRDHSAHLPARCSSARNDGTFEQHLLQYRSHRDSRISLQALRVVVARMTAQNTMGNGESQIGYLANYINLYGGHAPRPAFTQPSSSDSLCVVCRMCEMN